MDSNEFTATRWYTLQETSLVNLTVLIALWNIAAIAWYMRLCYSLLGAL